MTGKLRAWWAARGARLCAKGRHRWRTASAPIDMMGRGTAFSVNFATSMYYDHFRRGRCGAMARAVR